jgi:cell division protein FtsI (penicillin-binding protein 3)
MRLRVVVMSAIFVVLLAGVLTRAVQLQVHQNDRLKGLAEDQYVRAVEIPARRGDVFDRGGIPLAQSVDVDSVWIDPSMVDDVKSAAKALAKALGLSTKEVLDRLNKGKRFAWLKRQVPPSDVARVKALGIPGVGFAKEPRRFYPQRELAAHVLGLVGTDGRGLDGLELAFEDELSGERLKRDAFRDAKGRKLMTGGLTDSTSRAGANVTLTLDRQLQFLTERALQRAVEEAKATSGTAVVMDVTTGEVLALANSARLNPNSPESVTQSNVRNRAVTDTFEPGSTFKAFVLAAALDSKIISESSQFDGEQGSFRVGRNVIHDTHPHGLLTTKEVLQVSSNVCTTKIAALLGREKMTDAFKRFGFGERFGLGLPGEGKGQLPFPRADIALATQSFGQGLTATALQVAAGYAALANRGVLMKPYIVSRVVDSDGVVLLENKPTPLRQVVSERAAASIVSMLESVVEKGGTAPKARMDEYRVAGKTGTAQKADPSNRGYSDKRVASFVGVVPAESPRLVILLVVDEPLTDVYGGMVAAPAFKEIATQAMPYLGIRPSRAPLPAATAPVVKAAPLRKDVKSPVVAAIERLEEEKEPVTEGSVRVPNCLGLSARTATGQIMAQALEPKLNGSGSVRSQRPEPGSVVEKGTPVVLELASRLP